MNKEIELKPCREAFEAWVKLSDAPLTRCPESWNAGAYEDKEVQCAFMGFQAGYLAAQAQLQAENAELHGDIAFLKAELKAEKKRVDNYSDNLAALQHNEINE